MPLVLSRRGSPNLEKPRTIVRGQETRLPWAWDGLRFGAPLNTQSRDGLRDIVNNVPPRTIANGTWQRDKRGNPVYYLTKDFDYVEWPKHPRHETATTALTVYARFQRVGIIDEYGGIFTLTYDDADPWVSWAIQGDPASAGKLFGGMTLGTTHYSTIDTSVIPTTEYVSVFLRWRSGEAPRLDVLGERGNTLFTTTHTSTLTGSLGYGTTMPWGVRLNASEVDTSCGDARYSQAMAWSRRLSDVELACLTEDPFGWYSPRRETVVLTGGVPPVPGYHEPEWTFGQVTQVG